MESLYKNLSTGKLLVLLMLANSYLVIVCYAELSRQIKIGLNSGGPAFFPFSSSSPASQETATESYLICEFEKINWKDNVFLCPPMAHVSPSIALKCQDNQRGSFCGELTQIAWFCVNNKRVPLTHENRTAFVRASSSSLYGVTPAALLHRIDSSVEWLFDDDEYVMSMNALVEMKSVCHESVSLTKDNVPKSEQAGPSLEENIQRLLDAF